MTFRYAVLGAGRQGIAAAYDLGKLGDAEQVILVDADIDVAEVCANRVNELLGKNCCTALQANVSKIESLIEALDEINSIISAVPYDLNPLITEAAISIKANLCDLGGNTEIVRKQLERNDEAEEAGITIVPDCGMGPGMNISLALYAMSLLDKTQEVYIWDGGLPQNPKPPWNYALTFNIAGLTNEYYGYAYFLRNGKVTEVPCFEGYEVLEFPQPLGKLEAFVTSGGLSTMPWTFEGKLERLENKTLRYPGHWEQFKTYAQLGLLDLEPVQVGDVKVVPRDILHAFLEPKLTQPDIKDVCVIRVKCVGEKEGERAEAIVELMDHYDEKTGFSAMQRLTGWHASIIAILAAQGKIRRGAVPIETVPGKIVVEEARRRGFSISEHIKINDG